MPYSLQTSEIWTEAITRYGQISESTRDRRPLHALVLNFSAARTARIWERLINTYCGSRSEGEVTSSAVRGMTESFCLLFRRM